ncbi:MAG: hypothetical protein NTX79_07320 [Candidatus Micrarchaeota archaeon]|nr:hypothetical protein [Candidatus Micrarchaeota archaeon]
MVAKNALLFAALLASSMLFAGMGDWDGQLSINGTLAPDGTSVCAYVNGAAIENSRTTVGAYATGYYLMTVIGDTGDNVTFKAFCEYAVNEAAQNWSASPPRHHLNLSVTHTAGPTLTRVAPAATDVAVGTVTLTLTSSESATCRYSTTSGTAYASMTNTTTLGTTHSWSISAPTAATTYSYYARCINQFNQSSAELSLSFTTAGSSGGGGSTGGSGSGGGSTGGSGSTASTKATSEYSVDVGSGNSCQVTVTRELASSNSVSVLTTTLENTGGSSCSLENFTFSDTIPSEFAAINEITFNPMYSSREGWTVSFNFPTFAGGESKTLTYSVNGWVGSSRVKNFTIYEMSANKKQPAAAPTTPTTPAAQQNTTWIPTKLPAAPSQPVVQPAAPTPKPADNTGALLLTALVVVVVVAGIAGLAMYMKGRKKKGM